MIGRSIAWCYEHEQVQVPVPPLTSLQLRARFPQLFSEVGSCTYLIEFLGGLNKVILWVNTYKVPTVCQALLKAFYTYEFF